MAILGYGWFVYSFAEMAFSFLALYLSFYVLTLNRLQALTAKTATLIIFGILLSYIVLMETIAG